MKYFLLILSLLFFRSVFGQRETIMNLQNFESQTKFNWGYSLGFSSWDYKLTPAPKDSNDQSTTFSKIETEGSTGFSVGLLGMFNLHKLLDIRLEPSLHFVSRKLIFQNTELPEGSEDFKVNSTYLDLPILLHFRGARWNNIRPFIASGIGYIRNLQSNENSDDDASKGVFRTKTNNFDWQAEAGIEIYFKRFKMTPSIKGIFFINNERIADNPGTSPYWNGSISNISSRAITFSLKFE